MRRLKKCLLSLLVPVVFLSCLFVFSASAFAGEAWWHVQQVATPTHISKAREAGEVQSIVLSSECGGTAFEVTAGHLTAYFATSEALAKEDGVALLTPAALQKALEGEYGAGNVKVSVESGSPTGTEVLLVEGVKADLGLAVASIAVKAFAHAGSASVSVTRQPVPAGEIVIRATDLGDGPIEGAKTPVKLADTLPAGLEASGISGTVRGWYEKKGGTTNGGHGKVVCSTVSLSCEYAEDAVAFSFIEVKIPVIVTKTGAFSGSDGVTVAGGGGPAVARSQSVSVGEEPVPFGIEDESFEMTPEEEGGVADARPGSHPFQLTTAFTFSNTGEEGAGQAAQPRNLHFLTPPGLVGNAQIMPRCPVAEFDQPQPACPADTAIGVAVEAFSTEVGNGLNGFEAIPVFNLDPGPGEPARFAFSVTGTPIYLTTRVHSGEDYAVETDVDNITQQVAFSSSLVTLWGSPDNPLHNDQRGYACLQGEAACQTGAELPQAPFLTLPDSCSENGEGVPFRGAMTANAWTEPTYLPSIESLFGETLDGCNEIPFGPSVEVAPDVQSASSASGLTAHVRLPQNVGESANGVGEGTIRDTTVALPAGVQLNPSDSGGLEACSESQVGYLNQAGPHGELEFTGTLPAGWEEGLGGFCPKAAKIGTVSIQTPLLAKPVSGAVYLATPAPNGEAGQNPSNSLLAMYIVAENKEAGIAVKLPGKVALCQSAGETIEGIVCGAQGQLISTFADTPQLPFEDLELHFFGGERSPLSTPAHCGSYTTQAVFTPWSGVGSTGPVDLNVRHHERPRTGPRAPARCPFRNRP